MMLSHVSFPLDLIALVTGVCLYLWSLRAEPGSGLGLAKVVGLIVMILSIIGLILSLYSGLRPNHADQENETNMQTSSPTPKPTSQDNNQNNAPESPPNPTPSY